MLIVGINAYHGDVAAAIVRDGRLIAALEEERFARIKHVAGFPARAIERGLAMAGATAAEVDVWAVARGRRVHLLQKAREFDTAEVEPLRDVAYNDVVIEIGRSELAVPLTSHQRILAALA